MSKDNFNEFFFDVQSFKTKKNTPWSVLKYPVIFIGVAIVLFLLAVIIASAHNKPNAKRLTLYQIEVNTFGGSTLYLTSEYKIDSVTKCVQFKDAMGLKRKVCDHYTITTYLE